MKVTIFSFFLVLFSLTAMNTSFAQKSKPSKKEPKDVTTKYKYSKKEKERNAIVDKLWYGSGGALRYNRYDRFSLAQIGLSPMVGYKFNSFLSAGPRVEFNDYYIKGYAVDGEVHTGHSISYGAGLFARAKILQAFFIHGEMGYKREVFPVLVGSTLDLDPDDPTKIAKIKENRFPVLLGVGYNAGFYELGLYWDFNRKNLGATDLPIEYRVGLTFKF